MRIVLYPERSCTYLAAHAGQKRLFDLSFPELPCGHTGHVRSSTYIWCIGNHVKMTCMQPSCVLLQLSDLVRPIEQINA